MATLPDVTEETDRLRLAVETHPHVAGAAVVVGRSQANQPFVFVRSRHGSPIEIDSLRTSVEMACPGLSARAVFVVLDEAAPWIRAASSGAEGRTPLEVVLAGLWAHVLNVPAVDPDDNFLDLGGDSLSVTEMSSLVHQVLQMEVPASTFFEHATVAELARAVADRAPGGSSEQIARMVIAVAAA